VIDFVGNTLTTKPSGLIFMITNKALSKIFWKLGDADKQFLSLLNNT